NNSSAKWIKQDSVLIALAGQGKTRGKVAINRIPLTTNQSIAGIEPSNEVYYKFLYHQLTKDYLKLRLVSSGDGSRGGLNKKLLNDYAVNLSSIDEQHKLGILLSRIDNTLQLHERKCEELALIKKALLQNLFPKKDEIKPEVRYKNFSDAWEQRKLENFLQEYSIKSKIENEYPLLSSTNKGMEYREGRTASESNIGYKILEINDLVLSPQNLWLGNININTLVTGIVSPSYKTLKINNLNLYFLLPQLKTKRMLEKYKQVSVQGASVVRRNLDFTEFMNIDLI